MCQLEVRNVGCKQKVWTTVKKLAVCRKPNAGFIGAERVRKAPHIARQGDSKNNRTPSPA